VTLWISAPRKRAANFRGEFKTVGTENGISVGMTCDWLPWQKNDEGGKEGQRVTSIGEKGIGDRGVVEGDSELGTKGEK